MIFGRSRKRASELPMTSARPVSTDDDTAAAPEGPEETTPATPTATAEATTIETTTAGADTTDGPATLDDTAPPEAGTPVEAPSDGPATPDDATPAGAAPALDAVPSDDDATPASAPASIDVLDRTEHGPRDVDEIEDREGYLDLGAILVKPVDGVVLRLEVQEATNRVLAAVLDLGESSVQLQAFAAPRTAGIWDEIREQIAAGVTGQQGEAHEVRSHFGAELVAAVPAVAGADAGVRVARFVGIDGPRWFLRGVITGAAATDRDAAADIERLFRDIVVVRGAEAMAPRDLLPLIMPGSEAAPQPQDGQGSTTPPERGPEVTQIG